MSRLHDVAADGRLLITTDEARAEIEGRLAGDERPRPYSWWTDDVVGGIAPDGSYFAGELNSIVTPDREYIVYLRRSGGSPPARLGPGAGGGVTPDGKWVIACLLVGDRRHLTLYPTGPGQPRRLSLGSVEAEVGGPGRVSSSADGRLFGFVGVAPGESARAYVVASDGSGAPKAVTPEGTTSASLSPDGKRMAAADTEGDRDLRGRRRRHAGGRPGRAAARSSSPGNGRAFVGTAASGDLVRLDLGWRASSRIAPSTAGARRSSRRPTRATTWSAAGC
jgi:hypothetical protein